MAAIANPNVDSSLWFDSFSLLPTDLENLPLSADLPPSMVEKLKENRGWFLNTVTQFKTQEALNSRQVTVGSHKFNIKPHYKDLAFKLSSTLCLDEIQSYILVQRFLDNKLTMLIQLMVFKDFFLEIVLQYYTERQCLLKCVRQIIIHALNVDSSVKEEKVMWHKVVKIFSDGLEGKYSCRLLSSSCPEHMDVDRYILSAEEMLIEDNLVLELLFLAYYESLCTCRAAEWQELCMLYKDMTSASFNFVKMGVSAEAFKCIYRAKVRMLLVLVETLDFESSDDT